MTEQELIQHAKKLIAIPSTVDNPAALHAAVDFIADYINNYQGITVERFESNGVPSLLAYAGNSRPGEFDVLLNGHIDVVPGEPEDFVPRIENGKLYGRGAYDMKLAALIMTDVFCRVAATTHVKMALQIVTDEEVGGYDGARYQLDQGVRAKFAITGEMTDLDVCYESRGICWVEIAFKGIRAHGGHAWNGDNAIIKAGNFANAILQKYPMPKEKAWTTTANIAALGTKNVTYNQVPDEATLKIDFRFTSENHEFTSKKTVTDFVKSIDPTAEIIAFPVFEPAVYVPQNNPDLERLIQAVDRATGHNAALIQRHGGSDARHFAVQGIPCVEFGLGGDNLHTHGEYANLESVPKFRTALETFLYDYTSTPGQIGGDSNSHRPTISN